MKNLICRSSLQKKTKKSIGDEFFSAEFNEVLDHENVIEYDLIGTSG